MQEIGDSRVDIADNHEERGRLDLVGQKEDYGEIQADNNDALRHGFDDGAFSSGMHNLSLL
jgi:hypothetical protein